MMTPLSKVLQWIEEKQFSLPGSNRNIMILDSAALAAYVQSLMGEEKQMCVDCYYGGTAKFANEAQMIKEETPEQYFTQTYKQQTAK